jgi:osmotically-inducible protein OsmY
MVLPFEPWNAQEGGAEGHGSSATKASVQSALHAAQDLNVDEITVTIAGPYVVLEGIVHQKGDDDRAVAIAEEVVGKGYVRSRLLRHER